MYSYQVYPNNSFNQIHDYVELVRWAATILLTFSLPYMTGISVVIRQWT